MRHRGAAIALALAAAATAAPAQQAGRLSLDLVTPDPEKPVHAPVTVLVWRTSATSENLVWSVRADESDLSQLVVRRGRELLIALAPDSALGAGKHRLTADVCIPRGACATSDVTLDVLPAELRAPTSDGAKDLLLRTLHEIIRWLLPRQS